MPATTSLETNINSKTKSKSLRGEAQVSQFVKRKKAPSAKTKAAKSELIRRSVLAKQKIKLAMDTAKTQDELLAAASLRVNDILIAEHKETANAELFMTFNQWKEKGYSVNKGETSYKVWSAPIKAKREIEVTEVSTGQDKTLEEQYSMFAMVSLFCEHQVSLIDIPEDKIKADDSGLCIGEKVETVFNCRANTASGNYGDYLGYFEGADRVFSNGFTFDIFRNVEIGSDYFFKVVNVDTGKTAITKDSDGLVFAVREAAQPVKPITNYMRLPSQPKQQATIETKAPVKVEAPAPVMDVLLAEKLDVLAEKQQKNIDGFFADRQTNTPKRLAEANRARCQGEKLLRTQKALIALAQCHRVGNVPDVLKTVKTKKAVFDLMPAKSELVNNGYHTYYRDTGERLHDSAEAIAIWDLLTGKSPEEKASEALKVKIDGLQFTHIAGYFPTPKPVTDFMLELAQIEDNQIIADTSAGSGNILDAAKAHNSTLSLEAYEVNHTLCEILAAKNYSVIQGDSLQITNTKAYDRIIINPPFENLADIDHVQHSYDFLKSNGRLVAVMSASPFFRKDKKAVQFREWLAELNGEIHDLPDNSFKESGTGVNTKIIVIDKPDTNKGNVTDENPFVCANFDDKQESRRDRLEERAANASQKSTALWEQGHKMAEVIPFGQPILIGHHSEKRDHNYRAKFCAKFDKSMEESTKAGQLSDKAASVGTGGIASDDPQAIKKLRAKLIELEATQTRMKSANKAIKQNDNEALTRLGFNDKTIEALNTEDFAGRTGFASYQLTNNGAEIRRLKKRIESIESLRDTDPINHESDELKVFIEDGRIHFDFKNGKPAEAVRAKIKSYSFKFSRYSDTWVRKVTGSALNITPTVIKEIESTLKE